MFWGLIMEPQRRYTQTVKKSFHISMAALDISTSTNEPAQVMCGFEGRNYLLCTLQKPNMVQCALDLNFEIGSEVSFATNGKSHVHLTGYLTDDMLPGVEEEVDEEEDQEIEEENEAPIKTGKRQRKTENGPPPKRTKGEKEVVSSSQPTKSSDDDDEDDSDDSDVDMSQLLLQEESDDDEEDDEEASDEDDLEGLEGIEEEDDDDEEEEEDEDEVSDLSDEVEEMPKVKPGMNKSKANGDIKQSEKQKMKQAQATPNRQKEKQTENKSPKSEKKQQGNKQANVDQKTPGKDQKKGQKEQNKQKTPGKEQAKTPGKEQKTPGKEQNKTPGKDQNKTPGKSPKKRVVQGGVMIEDIAEGSGEVAKPGKFVHVYYEGRLKENNKMFDSTLKGPGFGFRLGKGEVIKGWDVGVAGMKAGGKRRITCPPGMAYGHKGSPPTIPANSTLVFEVELKKIG